MAGKAKAKKGDEEGEKKGMAAKAKPILAIVVAIAGYKFFLAPKPAAPAATGVAAAKVAPEEGVVVKLENELTLNLAGDETHYLRVGIALVLEKGVVAKTMTEELPIAADVVIDVLSAKTPEELRQADAKTQLKAELSERVREAYHDEKVVRVVFTSFVMQ
jgi:flagellar basal body-associated protein FliL